MLKKVWQFLPNLKILVTKINSVPNNEKGLNNYSFIGSQQNSKLQTLLYHLRNAIAHGKISKDDKYVHLTDWTNRKKHQSVIGRIKNVDFKKLLNIINNIPI